MHDDPPSTSEVAKLAEMLAQGVPWREVAKRGNVSQRAFRDIAAQPGFHDAVRSVAKEQFAALNVRLFTNERYDLGPMMASVIEAALDVQQEVILGNLGEETDRYRSARDMLGIVRKRFDSPSHFG